MGDQELQEAPTTPIISISKDGCDLEGNGKDDVSVISATTGGSISPRFLATPRVSCAPKGKTEQPVLPALQCLSMDVSPVIPVQFLPDESGDKIVSDMSIQNHLEADDNNCVKHITTKPNCKERDQHSQQIQDSHTITNAIVLEWDSSKLKATQNLIVVDKNNETSLQIKMNLTEDITEPYNETKEPCYISKTERSPAKKIPFGERFTALTPNWLKGLASDQPCLQGEEGGTRVAWKEGPKSQSSACSSERFPLLNNVLEKDVNMDSSYGKHHTTRNSSSEKNINPSQSSKKLAKNGPQSQHFGIQDIMEEIPSHQKDAIHQSQESECPEVYKTVLVPHSSASSNICQNNPCLDHSPPTQADAHKLFWTPISTQNNGKKMRSRVNELDTQERVSDTASVSSSLVLHIDNHEFETASPVLESESRQRRKRKKKEVDEFCLFNQPNPRLKPSNPESRKTKRPGCVATSSSNCTLYTLNTQNNSVRNGKANKNLDKENSRGAETARVVFCKTAQTPCESRPNLLPNASTVPQSQASNDEFTNSQPVRASQDSRKHRTDYTFLAHKKEVEALHLLISVYDKLFDKLQKGPCPAAELQVEKFHGILTKLKSSQEKEETKLQAGNGRDCGHERATRLKGRQGLLKQAQIKHEQLLAKIEKHHHKPVALDLTSETAAVELIGDAGLNKKSKKSSPVPALGASQSMPRTEQASDEQVTLTCQVERQKEVSKDSPTEQELSTADAQRHDIESLTADFTGQQAVEDTSAMNQDAHMLTIHSFPNLNGGEKKTTTHDISAYYKKSLSKPVFHPPCKITTTCHREKEVSVCQGSITSTSSHSVSTKQLEKSLKQLGNQKVGTNFGSNSRLDTKCSPMDTSSGKTLAKQHKTNREGLISDLRTPSRAEVTASPNTPDLPCVQGAGDGQTDQQQQESEGCVTPPVSASAVARATIPISESSCFSDMTKTKVCEAQRTLRRPVSSFPSSSASSCLYPFSSKQPFRDVSDGKTSRFEPQQLLQDASRFLEGNFTTTAVSSSHPDNLVTVEVSSVPAPPSPCSTVCSSMFLVRPKDVDRGLAASQSQQESQQYQHPGVFSGTSCTTQLLTPLQDVGINTQDALYCTAGNNEIIVQENIGVATKTGFGSQASKPQLMKDDVNKTLHFCNTSSPQRKNLFAGPTTHAQSLKSNSGVAYPPYQKDESSQTMFHELVTKTKTLPQQNGNTKATAQTSSKPEQKGKKRARKRKNVPDSERKNQGHIVDYFSALPAPSSHAVPITATTAAPCNLDSIGLANPKMPSSYEERILPSTSTCHLGNVNMVTRLPMNQYVGLDESTQPTFSSGSASLKLKNCINNDEAKSNMHRAESTPAVTSASVSVENPCTNNETGGDLPLPHSHLPTCETMPLFKTVHLISDAELFIEGSEFEEFWSESFSKIKLTEAFWQTVDSW